MNPKKMRILITGSGLNFNTSLACFVAAENKDRQWTVVTSYQNSVAMYTNVPNIPKVVTYKDVKDDDIDSLDANHGTIIEVLAQSFFDKPWVSARIKQPLLDLIIVTTSPVSTLDKAMLDQFDHVYITKTTVADKQSQYYTLFVDTAKTTFTDFKKLLKNLLSTQYVHINRSLKTIETQTYVPAWQQPKIEETLEPTVAGLPPPPPPPTKVPVMSKLERPKSMAAPATGFVELWLCLYTSTASDEAVENIRAMLKNELIQTMVGTSLYHQRKEPGSPLNVYLQIAEQRQDLFASLAMNMLQSLRAAGIITQGGLVIM
jgi:hypothetical protein